MLFFERIAVEILNKYSTISTQGKNKTYLNLYVLFSISYL